MREEEEGGGMGGGEGREGVGRCRLNVSQYLIGSDSSGAIVTTDHNNNTKDYKERRRLGQTGVVAEIKRDKGVETMGGIENGRVVESSRISNGASRGRASIVSSSHSSGSIKIYGSRVSALTTTCLTDSLGQTKAGNLGWLGSLGTTQLDYFERPVSTKPDTCRLDPVSPSPLSNRNRPLLSEPGNLERLEPIEPDCLERPEPIEPNYCGIYEQLADERLEEEGRRPTWGVMKRLSDMALIQSTGGHWRRAVRRGDEGDSMSDLECDDTDEDDDDEVEEEEKKGANWRPTCRSRRVRSRKTQRFKKNEQKSSPEGLFWILHSSIMYN